MSWCQNGSVHSAGLSPAKYNIHTKQKAVSKIHHLTQTLASRFIGSPGNQTKASQSLSFFSSSFNPGELWVSVQMAELITYSLLTTVLQGGVLVQVHMKYTVYMWPQMFGHADHWLVVYNSSSESSSSCKVFINVLALVCYIVTAHSLEQCIVLFQYHLNHDKWLSQYDTMWHNVHNRLNK